MELALGTCALGTGRHGRSRASLSGQRRMFVHNSRIGVRERFQKVIGLLAAFGLS